jgi:DNA polymerase-3 subunit beta
MKFEIDRSELLNAVTIAAKASAQKGVRPILANLLIDASEDKLRLVATDMEAMSIIEIAADVADCGKITAPAKLLQEMLSNLPNDSLFPVEVSADKNTDEINFVMGKNKFSIRGLSADDFPPVPSLDAELFPINGAELSKAIKQAAISASTEEGNPVQKSVYFDFAENAKLVSTDSKRLTVCDVPELKIADNLKAGFIVPIKAANEVAAMFTNADDAKIGIFKGQMIFKTGHTTYLTRTIDARFPDAQRVIPKESNIAVKFYKKELSQALKSLSPIAKNNSNFVKLDISSNEIKLSSDGKENGKAETSIPCNSDGEIQIAFNLKYLQDFLNVAEADEISLMLTSSAYPGMLVDGDDLRYVVMPMSFQ